MLRRCCLTNLSPPLPCSRNSTLLQCPCPPPGPPLQSTPLTPSATAPPHTPLSLTHTHPSPPNPPGPPFSLHPPLTTTSCISQHSSTQHVSHHLLRPHAVPTLPTLARHPPPELPKQLTSGRARMLALPHRSPLVWPRWPSTALLLLPCSRTDQVPSCPRLPVQASQESPAAQ